MLKEVSLSATRQERRKREAKANADEAASEPHNIDNIGEDSEREKNIIFLVFLLPKKLK